MLYATNHLVITNSDVKISERMRILQNESFWQRRFLAIRFMFLTTLRCVSQSVVLRFWLLFEILIHKLWKYILAITPFEVQWNLTFPALLSLSSLLCRKILFWVYFKPEMKGLLALPILTMMKRIRRERAHRNVSEVLSNTAIDECPPIWSLRPPVSFESFQVSSAT